MTYYTIVYVIHYAATLYALGKMHNASELNIIQLTICINLSGMYPSTSWMHFGYQTTTNKTKKILQKTLFSQS